MENTNDRSSTEDWLTRACRVAAVLLVDAAVAVWLRPVTVPGNNLQPFGCRVLATRRHPERGPGEIATVELFALNDLAEVLAQSDIVVVAAPLTDETAGLIGAEQLAQMREDAWLINIARGRLIDELALRRALESGWIGGAVLDVFSEEPLSPESPLYRTPNVIITPHTSWASDRVIERTVELFVDNLRRDRAGEPLRNLVDLEAGY